MSELKLNHRGILPLFVLVVLGLLAMGILGTAMDSTRQQDTEER